MLLSHLQLKERGGAVSTLLRTATYRQSWDVTQAGSVTTPGPNETVKTTSLSTTVHDTHAVTCGPQNHRTDIPTRCYLFPQTATISRSTRGAKATRTQMGPPSPNPVSPRALSSLQGQSTRQDNQVLNHVNRSGRQAMFRASHVLLMTRLSGKGSFKEYLM